MHDLEQGTVWTRFRWCSFQVFCPECHYSASLRLVHHHSMSFSIHPADLSAATFNSTKLQYESFLSRNLTRRFLKSLMGSMTA